MSDSISPKVLPNEVKLLIFAYLDATSLLGIFRASKLFNQLALVTHYAQHGLSPPFSQASFSSSIFPGISLALSAPPLNSLTFTFDTPNVLHTINALTSFCARNPYPIPRIHLIFQHDPLHLSAKIPRTHTILKALESLLTTATDSGRGGSLVRVSPAGVHLMPVSSPLRPELNHFNPRPNLRHAHDRTPEQKHVDREPKIIALLLICVVLGQTKSPKFLHLTPISFVAVVISMVYFAWWGFWRWKKYWRPVATTMECEGIVRSVPSMTQLTSIEIYLPLEKTHGIGTDSELPMRPLLVFNRKSISTISIPPTSEAPISPLQIEELLLNTDFPVLRRFVVEAICHSCVANTTLYSFLARHPMLGTLTYFPTCVPLSGSACGRASRSSLFQNLLFLSASPEFISYFAHETSSTHDDAEFQDTLPSADFLPSLRSLAITPRGDIDSPSTLSYPTSFRAATDAALHNFSSRSDTLHLDLYLLEDGHEDEWLAPYDFPPPSANRTSTPSMPYVPCVVSLSFYWYPRWMTPAMPGYLQRFRGLERLGLMDLVWDRKTSDAWWGGVDGDDDGDGDTRERERAEEWEWFRDREIWKVKFVRELRRACPLLTLLMIGSVERGLDEWEAIFAAERTRWVVL
ncbi:hypothetical protein BDZ94DRAFT_1263652 [Collybia nuda]|uniref:F-box domain-containing protein n=1 Tax=Collybia nuda TaxID=64659 RepID=A0A9P5Y588_9AGAR|nr:hypothetical protein BDZ94DRAFT_1263652 [Collybia nuda]